MGYHFPFLGNMIKAQKSTSSSMICLQDSTNTVWRKLTAEGLAILDGLRSGGDLPSEIVTTATESSRKVRSKRSRIGNRFRPDILTRLKEQGFPVAEELGVAEVAENGFYGQLRLLRLPWPGLSLKNFFRHHYPVLPSREKWRFLLAFARFLRKTHDAGVVVIGALELDLMVAIEQEQIRFCLSGSQPLALHHRPLKKHHRFKVFGALLSASFGKTTRSERFRFLKAYLNTARLDGRLDRTAQREAKRHWHRQARRCLGSNRRFVQERRDGFRINRLRQTDASAALETLLPDPDRAFIDAVIYKPGSRTHVGLVELAGRRYFLKRYNMPAGWFRLVNLFRRSRARRTWLATWGFVARGLPVARPVLCLERRRWRLLGSCYILMEFVEGTERLSAVWPKLDEAGQEKCLMQLGSMLGRLHYSGGLHGDLKWNNIVLRQNSPDDIHLVDFDGSQIVRRATFRRALQDLERFLRDLGEHDVPDSFFSTLFRSWRRWTGTL
jgi:hypothetical protein